MKTSLVGQRRQQTLAFQKRHACLWTCSPEIRHGVPSFSVESDRRRTDASGKIPKTQEKGTSDLLSLPIRTSTFFSPSVQKKALQALKAPKSEPEKTPTLKRPAEARDAREVAKKLLKSGAIQAIPKPCEKTETAGFKRSRGLERKLSSSDRAPSGFQPFSAAQGGMPSDDHSTREVTAKPKVSPTQLMIWSQTPSHPFSRFQTCMKILSRHETLIQSNVPQVLQKSRLPCPHRQPNQRGQKLVTLSMFLDILLLRKF